MTKYTRLAEVACFSHQQILWAELELERCRDAVPLDSLGEQANEVGAAYLGGYRDAMAAIHKRLDVDTPPPFFAPCRQCGTDTRYRDANERARCGDC